MIEAFIRGDNRPSRDLLAASYEHGSRVAKPPGASRTLHTGMKSPK
jgi:hypothetical protein